MNRETLIAIDLGGDSAKPTLRERELETDLLTAQIQFGRSIEMLDV